MPEQTPEDTQRVDGIQVTSDEAPDTSQAPKKEQEPLPQTADTTPLKALALFAGAAACIALFGTARLVRHQRRQR